jgi:nicotinate-nucleotide adenylyltransferase
VAVCSAEAELRDDPLVGKTARTLEHLVAKHPDHRFALLVGADLLPDTDKWWRWDRVQELARVVVIGREGYPPVPGAPSLPAISSTEVRARLERGDDVSGLVPRKVREYVEERGLYRGR